MANEMGLALAVATQLAQARSKTCVEFSFGWIDGGAYLAKPDSAKSESAVQERAKPYLAKPVN